MVYAGEYPLPQIEVLKKAVCGVHAASLLPHRHRPSYPLHPLCPFLLVFAPHPLSCSEIRKGDDMAPTSLKEGRGSHRIAGDIGGDMACAAGAVVGVDVVLWRCAVVGDDGDMAVWTAYSQW